MQENELSLNYITAEGPEGLSHVLNNLLAETDGGKTETLEHYILYQLGNQKSLIKVDMSEQPFQFWYYDLLGRPATKAVKDVLGDFAWEKGGEKKRALEDTNEEITEACQKWKNDGFQDKNFHDVGKELQHKLQTAFLSGGKFVLSVDEDNTLAHALRVLENKHKLEALAPVAELVPLKKTTSSSLFGLFSSKQAKQIEAEKENKLKNDPGSTPRKNQP